MPSFTVSNQNYKYYLAPYVDSFSFIGNTCHRMLCISCIILGTTVMGYVLFHWITIFLLHHNSIHGDDDILLSYSSRHLNVLYFNKICHSFFVALHSSLIALLLWTTLSDTYILSTIFVQQDIITIAKSIGFVLCVTTVLVLSHILVETTHPSTTRDVIQFGSFICSFDECENISVLRLLLFFEHSFVIIISCIFFICRSWVHRQTETHRLSKIRSSNRYVIDTTMNAETMELGLLESDPHDMFIENAQYDESYSDADSLRSVSGTKQSTTSVYVLLFSLCYVLFGFCNLLFIDMDQTILENHFVWIYLALVGYICMCKIILKALASKCDEIRAKHHRWNYFISIQYLMEFIVSFVYYSYFVSILILLNMNPNEHDDAALRTVRVVVVICLHFVYEILETSIKLTQKYFDVSNAILHGWNVGDYHWCCRFLYDVFQDESSVEQWKYRLSMDMALRMYVAVCVYSTNLLSVFVMKKRITTSDNIYIHLTVVFAVELVLSFIVSIIQSVSYDFNLFELFINYCTDITKLQKLLFMLLFVGAVIIF
eukprot:74187_1